jgi:rod shape-determining protein MreB
VNKKNSILKKHRYRFFFKDIAVDLGTNSTQIYLRRKGLVVEEPSVIAFDLARKKIIAIGKEAKRMIGKTPQRIRTVKPLQDGVVADFETTKQMLIYFFRKAGVYSSLFRLRAIITVPFGTTQIEKRAVVDAGRAAGAKEIYLIEEPLAAAIGANINVEEPQGNLIINIGGGATEIAVISLGGIARGESLRFGGNDLNTYIQRYIRNHYRLEIGESTAEQVKKEAVYALDPPKGRIQPVSGINLRSGLPESITIPVEELSAAIKPMLETLSVAIKKTFEQVSPQLASDIIQSGIFLTGGGAMLKKIGLFLQKKMLIPVHIAQDPTTCAVRGASKALEELHAMRHLELYHSRN